MVTPIVVATWFTVDVSVSKVGDVLPVDECLVDVALIEGPLDRVLKSTRWGIRGFKYKVH